YNTLRKQDVLDIIAYIRTLKPIRNEVPQRQLFIPISMAYPPNLNKALDQNVKPEVGDKIKYGEYLVTMAGCIVCHTPTNEKGQLRDPFSGGNTFHLPTFTVTSANLTPDSTTGIGAWTEEVFLNKFKNYRNKDAYQYNAGKNNSIMPWPIFANIDDYDLKAIYAYLHSLKPVKNKIEKWPVAKTK
ncbi:MAG: cytochrome c, partial [Bacteroidota bacterium]|nr:cytochrome c [Bacteroidota bacterium]